MGKHPGISIRLTSGAEPMDLTQAREVDVAISYGRALERPGVEVASIGKEQIAPMCSPSLKDAGRSWKQVMGELTLIDSQLSQVTWRDWFNLNKLQLPERPRQSFDRGALSISAAADGIGVALETTRFAERELARGDLVLAGSSEFQIISRENHFFSQRTNECQVEKVKKFKDWLLEQVHASTASAAVRRAKAKPVRRAPRKQGAT
jgi:DNA-binding transcriptional LysR family regulator